MKKYIRTKTRIAKLLKFVDMPWGKDACYSAEGVTIYYNHSRERIIKEADTISKLIMKGDLVFYKDLYSGVNANERPSIAYNDIDKSNQYFEQEITKIFIEDTNGNFIKVAELDNRHDLEII